MIPASAATPETAAELVPVLQTVLLPAELATELAAPIPTTVQLATAAELAHQTVLLLAVPETAVETTA